MSLQQASGGSSSSGTGTAAAAGGNRLQIASDLNDLLQGTVDMPASLMTHSGSKSRRSSLPRPMEPIPPPQQQQQQQHNSTEPSASAASKPSFMQPTAAYAKKTKSNRSSQENRHFLFDTITPVHHTAVTSASSPKSGASVWDVKSSDKVSGSASSRSSAVASALPSKAGSPVRSVAVSVAPSQRNSARNSGVGLEVATTTITIPTNASSASTSATASASSSITSSLVSPAHTVAPTIAQITSPLPSPAAAQPLPSPLNSPSSTTTTAPQSAATTPAAPLATASTTTSVLPSPRLAAASSKNNSMSNATTPRLPKAFSGAARRMIEAVEQVAVQQQQHPPVAPGSGRPHKNAKKFSGAPLAPVDSPSSMSAVAALSSPNSSAATTTSNLSSPSSVRPAPVERATSLLTGGTPRTSTPKRHAAAPAAASSTTSGAAPLPFAASLLATSDLDFAPVTARTVNLNASSAPVAVQVQPPNTGRNKPVTASGGDAHISVPANADTAVIAALVEKVNSRAASNAASTAVSNTVSHTNSGSNSPKPRSFEEAIAAHVAAAQERGAAGAGAGGPLAPLTPHAPTSAKSPSSVTTPLSPRLASLKPGGGDAKRKTTERAQSIAAQETFSLNTGVVKEIKPSVNRSLSTNGNPSGIITAQEEVLLSSPKVGAVSSSSSVVPVLVSSSASSSSQRPSYIRTPSSVAQPSPSMMSRPSVSFVATQEGMSLQEAAAAAKLREKEMQLAQSIAAAEALAAKISTPNSPVRGSINALSKASPSTKPLTSPRNPSLSRLSLGGGVTSPPVLPGTSSSGSAATSASSTSMASPRLSMRTPSLSGISGATSPTASAIPSHSRSGSLIKRASYVASGTSPTTTSRTPMSINLPGGNSNTNGMDSAYSPTTNLRRTYYTGHSHRRHGSSVGSASALSGRRDSMNSATGNNDAGVSPQVDNDYAVLSDDEDPELNDLAWGDHYSDTDGGEDKEKRRDSMKGRRGSTGAGNTDGGTEVGGTTADEERELRARRRALRSSSMISEGSGENTEGTNSLEGSSPGSPTKRSSTGPFTLIDPLTGLPFDRSKKRSSAVYMGLLNDTDANGIPIPNSRMNSMDLQNVQNLLNALSPLHHAASSLSSNSGLSSPMSPSSGIVVGDGSSGGASMDAIMRSVKVERVELKNLRKAPTLMQQAKVITAAIIMQRQAQIAERRAIIQKKKEEAEAFEAELERRAMEQEELAKQQRIKEFQLQAERNYMREIGFMGDPNSPHHTGVPSHSRHLGSGLNLSGPGLYDSKEGNGSTPNSPGGVDRRMSWAANRASWSRSRQNSILNEPYSPNSQRGSERRSMNFSQFDFSGTGTAWGKDQIGSHLRQRSIARTSMDASSMELKPAEEEDPSKKIHPSGFGTGSVSDNNGAHHPLMNPTHPNFFSHLNPNSTNYNSHINPNHVNYNPLNNPTHPDHDPKYNNPRHPLFNPFYRLPKMMENKDFMESTQHLHKGSPTHPSHPAHPLFTPHAKNLIPLGDADAGNSNLVSPAHTNNIVTPSGGMYRWGADGGELRPNHLRINSRSSYRSDGSPLLGGLAGPPGLSRPTSLLRQGSVHSPPVSPRSTFGAKTLAPLLKRQIYLQEKQEYEAAVQAEIEKETKTVNTLTSMKEALVTGPKKPLFDPKDPLASLDLTGKTGVALSKQFSKLNHRQVESIRRETVNAALGMGGVTTDLHALDPSDPHAAEKAAAIAASAPVVMSKFFRETLQKALGGDDIWKMAKDISNNTSGSKKGPVFDPLEGVSLSSISLKAHMALFGAGAFTDSDGRPLDEHGNYLDLMDEDGNQVSRGGGSRAVAIAPFPPKKFFLKDEVERYEAELREQLKKDHEQRVKEYEDVVNVAKRKWQADLEAHAQRLAEFHDNQDALIERGARVQESAAFLGKAVANQWNIY